MKVSEFEAKAWEVDGVAIVVRAPKDAEVGEFHWGRALGGDSRVTEWLEGRIYAKLNGCDAEVLSGSGRRPNGNTKMRSLRESYNY